MAPTHVVVAVVSGGGALACGIVCGLFATDASVKSPTTDGSEVVAVEPPFLSVKPPTRTPTSRHRRFRTDAKGVLPKRHCTHLTQTHARVRCSRICQLEYEH
jgi:hypothetical protein